MSVAPAEVDLPRSADESVPDKPWLTIVWNDPVNSESLDFGGATPIDGVTGTALLTDHYELTMLQAALHSGAAHRRAVFEVFARHLPHGRRYGVVAGPGRLLDAIERFRFGPEELSFLRDTRIVDETTLR